MRQKIFFFSVIAIVLFCCKKDSAPLTQPTTTTSSNCGQTHYSNVDTFLINNFIFNAGTYWIFQDSVNNVSDSVFSSGRVSADWHWSVTGLHYYCPYSARYVQNNNSNNARYYNYFVTGNGITQYCPRAYGSVLLITSQNNALQTSSTVNYIGNYTLGSLSFDSVYKCKAVIMPNYSYIDSGYVYLRAHVGLIRQETYSLGVKNVYNLLRYQIQ